MPCPLRPFLAAVAPRALGSHCQAPAVPPVSGRAPRWSWAEAGLQLWVLGLVRSGLAGQSSWEPRPGCRPGLWGRWAWCAVFRRCCRFLELSLEAGGRPAGGWTLRPGWAALGVTPEALASSGSSGLAGAGGARSTGGALNRPLLGCDGASERPSFCDLDSSEGCWPGVLQVFPTGIRLMVFSRLGARCGFNGRPRREREFSPARKVPPSPGLSTGVSVRFCREAPLFRFPYFVCGKRVIRCRNPSPAFGTSGSWLCGRLLFSQRPGTALSSYSACPDLGGGGTWGAGDGGVARAAGGASRYTF